MFDIIVVGGGPAGLTAALYARRNGRDVLVLEKEGFGGQIAFAPRVENYPGVGSVEGAELAERMLTQALDAGAETDIGTVTAIRDRGDHRVVYTEEGDEYETRAVILAAGARHRMLGLPMEEELLGSGLSYCAVCDGSFYAGGAVAVVGGGDSALQEALLLSDICREVVVIHRRDAFRGDAEKQKRLFARDNVRVLTPRVVTAFRETDGALTGVNLRNVITGEEEELKVDAVFVSVGREPQLEAFRELLPLTEKGYAAVGEDGYTPHPWLFAAGDCRKKEVRQLTTAVGDGAAAALAACRYLETLE